jgi:type II secretory pathway pseudopilin PulG
MVIAPRIRSKQAAFTYIGVLLAVALIGAGLALAGRVWATAVQREKEKQLIFVGHEYRRAIGRYFERSPGALKLYPRTLEELLLDKRYPFVLRHLRKLYADPMTGKTDWGLIKDPGGGIVGVYSLSDKAPFKLAGFRPDDASLEDQKHYSDWKFVYTGNNAGGTPPGGGPAGG